VHPLLFLTSRTLVNGVRRTLTNPRRLIGFLGFVAYFFMITSRAFVPQRGNAGPHIPFKLDPHFPLVDVLSAAVFAVYLVLSLFLISGLGTLYNRTTRPADIDVLFPTPVSPKLVMAYRVTRDYLATTLLPLIFVIFGWRSIHGIDFGGVFPNHEAAGYVIQTIVGGWFLLSMVWTTFGYATTLFINRSDVKSDRNRRILDIATYVLLAGTVAFIVVGVRSNTTWPGVVSLLHSGWLRGTYFLPTLASIFALGPVTNPWLSVGAGAALLCLVVVGYAVALTQVGWMYDQAAVRGFETVESIRQRRAGGIYVQMAHAAQKGKLKAGRQTRLHRMRVRPTATFMWREAIVQLRSMKTSALIIVIVALLYSLMPLFMFSMISKTKGDTPIQLSGYGFLVCQGFGIFMALSVMASTGFIEFLTKVDLLKPFPFAPQRLAMMEILAKTLFPVILVGFVSVVAVCVEPAIWNYVLASVIFMPPFAFVLCSTLLLVMVLFPEVEDRSGRGFRGLVQLFGLAVFVSPGIAIFVGFSLLVNQPIVSALFGAVVNIAIFVGTSMLAGTLYSNFNPNE
jgi:hypothetical protein